MSQSQAFVPLSFDPGEAYQFDWSHEYARLSGVTTKVKAAHMRLCYSRMQLVQIFPRESQEMVFEAHERAFRFFGGVCRRGIYDNMKTAVSTVFVGKKRDYNRRFQEMCSHHLVEPVACTPGAGWEKGQVERQVGDVRGRLFVPSPRGRSYAEINEWLMDRCIEDAKKHPHPTIPGKTVSQVFEEERPFLMAYRGPFDGFHATEVAVSKTCLVRFDNNIEADVGLQISPVRGLQYSGLGLLSRRGGAGWNDIEFDRVSLRSCTRGNGRGSWDGTSIQS